MVEKIFSLHRAFQEERLHEKERHLYDIYFLLKRPEISSRLGSKEHRSIKENIALHDLKFNNKHLPENLDFSKSLIFSKNHAQSRITRKTYEESLIYFGKRPGFDEMMEFINYFSKKF